MKITTSMSFGMFTEDGKNTECNVFYSTPVTEENVKTIWMQWNVQLQIVANRFSGCEVKEGESHTTSVRIEMIDNDPKMVVRDMCSRYLVFPSTDELDEIFTAALYNAAVSNGGKTSPDFDKTQHLIEKIKRETEAEIAQAGNEEPLDPNDEAGKEV